MNICGLKKVEMTPVARGQVIKKKLKLKRIEQKDLALELGITPKKLSEYLTGKIKTIPLEILNFLCQRLELDYECDFVVWEIDPLSYDEGKSAYVIQTLEFLHYVKSHSNDSDYKLDGGSASWPDIRYGFETLFRKFLHEKELEQNID